ncbi:hypothetical protein [Shewanella marina]|uniref:hypothetical protein n=1 Tax=Shewanella marina TaxID=487319 RepID=UPI0004708A80|nr:hypothetical protein [Shewanella marina]
MSLSAILTEAYHFFRNHLAQLAVLTMPILLIQIGLQMWLGLELSKAAETQNPQFGAPHMAAMMALLLAFSLLIAVLTVFLQLRSEGHQVTTGLVFKTGLTFVPPLLIAGVFSGLAILAPVFLFAAFGPFWLIGLVISFYLFARLAYVNFMVITERLTPMQAIKASFAFSGGGIAFKTLTLLMLYIPLSMIGGGLVELVKPAGLPAEYLVSVVMAFIGLFVNVALFRLYMVNRQPQL